MKNFSYYRNFGWHSLRTIELLEQKNNQDFGVQGDRTRLEKAQLTRRNSTTFPPPRDNYDLLVGNFVEWKRYSLSARRF